MGKLEDKWNFVFRKTFFQLKKYFFLDKYGIEALYMNSFLKKFILRLFYPLSAAIFTV